MAIDGKTESSQGSISDIIVHPRLAEQFGYELRIVNNGGISQLNNANRAFLNIKEDGNTLEFKEKRNFNSSLFVILLKKIETTTTITSQTKQIMIKRNSVLK
jgi:predicted glutamine amidotransferase